MPAYNKINEKTHSTHSIVENYIATESVNLLKKLRFDVGCFDQKKFEQMSRLGDILQRRLCSDEEEAKIRSLVIKTGLQKLTAL